MTDGRIAPVKVNTIGKCKILIKNCPTGLFVEKTINNIKPSTVGGSTIGNIIKLSKILTQFPFLLYNHLDINTPTMATMIVLVMATCREIQNDVKSSMVDSSLHSEMIFFKNFLCFR